ncbi:M20/M25/M40 family metallo-hydrolase [Hymenobacter lapidiphilus]|uniref:M28 family metallopeptidase n=1 Tax=Hymenobacter sp. CCM 8763 TaxID=2303334 RepID=UPI000E351514|nr:M28 family peptidase [Hymenobacter sp. CCM 8763]RFP65395.1 M20/M25/M40 family metallo-hydrolase [Hymenobacter sp. CCM 8763]
MYLNRTRTFSAARPLAALGLLLGSALARPAPTTAQDMARVRQTIARLTAPDLHGRGYVSGGEQRAAAYLQGRFRDLGLQPLAPDYYQFFTLPVNTFPGRAELRADGQPLRPGLDFIAAPNSGPGEVRGPVYRLDSLVFAQPAARQKLLATPLAKAVLVLTQAQAGRLTELPPVVQAHLATAGAQLTLVPGKLTASIAGEQAPRPRLEVRAAAWPAAAHTVRLRLDARLRPAYRTQNVVGYLPGTARPDSFVVVSAHYDHLGRLGRDTYFPGANDNASGVAMLLELAAHYARPENRPAYSIAFLAFGAEEAGLVGSRYFVEHPLLPLPAIRVLANLDLLGTGEEGLMVVNGRVFEDQFARLQRLNAAGGYVASLAARGQAANSDHFPFSERGVPALFFYTRGGIAAYHDVQDRSETLPLTAFRAVFGLLRDFLNGAGATPGK